jgi:hypothetical protein
MGFIEPTAPSKAELAAQLGHSKKSLTLGVYSHVLIDEP